MSEMRKNNPWNFKELILDEIKKNGGWINAHVHADRAFTIHPQKLADYKKYSLEQKWDLVDDVKKNASVDEYYRRISQALELMISQGVTAVCSNIDIDPIAEDRAIKGAIKAREVYKDKITIIYSNQVIKGVIEKQARYWFDRGAELVDIIGGLPERDKRDYDKYEEHLDIIFQTAKKLKKRLHIHADQFNRIEDKGTEMICNKTEEYGLQGRVSIIHALSIAAHNKAYREKVYKKLRNTDISVIACPTAWIDSKRKEELQPFHNSVTPIDEMIPAGITVALGTDNIADFMVPFCDADLWYDLKLLAIANRYVTEIDELVKIATVNGRKVLGLKPDDPGSS
ncbi:hypothetical protein A3C23_02415 [Candidatus Roizmanbacteria bacterium RIFCSPHIGHO2_02_FULL_37_13b]|uniref:Amidohydrolase 3 domain-containing protein n=1 Tax=Candidatus Roizmanbacteria bacterium RIFCSPLOWO2_02_FULL_36_11 TaxID=1802071 RepID=A0A1F7JIN3_9BACT|nr:MAG: hypothetical protein A3C23_02415 [Candidatus Roizmanbacteria bacterium RIFCSPHIGHO2_02_FULL_37_13b]OGK55488.1 MAG: hypothetical protein A3H78_04960 [Candidatus Roizmanbacteria bacterium RIFCSPLOWO2_02_FULL_36_11]